MKTLTALLLLVTFTSIAHAGPQIVAIDGGTLLKYQGSDLEKPSDLARYLGFGKEITLNTATKTEFSFLDTLPLGRCVVSTPTEFLNENSRLRVSLRLSARVHFEDPTQGARRPHTGPDTSSCGPGEPYHNPDRKFSLLSVVVTSSGSSVKIPIKRSVPQPWDFGRASERVPDSDFTWWAYFDQNQLYETQSMKLRAGEFKVELCDLTAGMSGELSELELEILQERP